MDKLSTKKAHEILEKYISQTKRRRTEERFKILDAVYSYSGMFTMFDLQMKMEKYGFMVSRATLYNCMKLFVEQRLVMRHKMEGESKYEPLIGRKNHCCQICTICGRRKELKIRSMPALRNNIPVERFTAEAFDIVVYGICSSCKAQQTRRLRKEAKMIKK